MKKSWLLMLLPAALLLWWGLYRREPAVVIHFSPVTKTTIESTVSTNGKAEPAEWAAARAQSAGVVNSIQVQRGQTLQAGQTLITLNAQLAQSELAGALARQQETQSEAAVVDQGGKAAAVASLEDSLQAAKAARDVAQRNYDSLQRLVPQQAATKLQVEQARDALERATMQVASIENQRKTMVTALDKSAAQARVKDAQAAVQLASERLKFAEVRSPLSGTLYQFDLKPGAYLQPGDLVGLVGTLDRMKVTVYVDEPDLGRVALGMPVTITWDAQPGKQWKGRVDRLPTEVVALGTRTVGEVTTVVDNPNHDLLPGVSVNATIVSHVVKDAISIPKAALRTMAGQTGVYKLVGDHLEWTLVKPGASDISNVEILSGVTTPDRVADRVVDPAEAELTNGLRVKAQTD